LRERFRLHKPQVVTFSALESSQIVFPEEGKQYFEHFEHWQKPLPYSDMITKLSKFTTSRKEG
jgi:hypothetical protein